MIRIKELRKELKITQNQLAEDMNLSRSTIAMYETNSSEPDFETLKKFAHYFGVSIDYLLGVENNVSGMQFNRDVVKIPIFGEIPAGTPIEMIEDTFIDDYEEIDASLCRGGNTFFGLKVKGNSMYPEFRNGDVIIFKQQDGCESGNYCAVSINHTECTFKKVIKKESGLTLMPLNADYEPLFFTNQEVEELPITILGVVKEVRRSY